jgi:hypothetical protein
MIYEIANIEKLFPDWYSKDSPLSFEDQKWIWENIPLPEEDEIKLKELDRNGNVSVISESDTYKYEVNSQLNWYKSEAIHQLKQCNSYTPPNKIAPFLEEIFKYWKSEKENHWLWIAQHYAPRICNWVMAKTIKKFTEGGIIKTPPAYFTYLLKYRSKRKEFRNTNDTHRNKYEK